MSSHHARIPRHLRRLADPQPYPAVKLSHTELAAERDMLLRAIERSALTLRRWLSLDVDDRASRQLQADAARLRELYVIACRRGVRL